MYKRLTSNRDGDDISIGFDRDRKRRRDELSNKEKIKGKYLLGIVIQDVFGFAEHQKKLSMAQDINYH